jgi:hypothetical protein
MKLYIFRTVSLSVIRSYSLYTQQWHVIQTAFEQQQDQDGTAVPSWSCCSKTVYKPVWHIPLLIVQWITPDGGQRNFLKYVEFHFQNKFEKLVRLVGFIIRKNTTSLLKAEFIRNMYWRMASFSYKFWYFRVAHRHKYVQVTGTGCIVLKLLVY